MRILKLEPGFTFSTIQQNAALTDDTSAVFWKKGGGNREDNVRKRRGLRKFFLATLGVVSPRSDTKPQSQESER